MLDRTPHCDAQSQVLTKSREAWTVYSPRKNEKLACVGHFNQLRDDTSRRPKGRMHFQTRAGTAMFCKMEVCRVKPLRDIPCPICAKKEKRHPASVAALKGRCPVTSLLETNAKASSKVVNVVFAIQRFFQKTPIGHQDRCSKVVRRRSLLP